MGHSGRRGCISIIGFLQFGWKAAGAADLMAQESANAVVVTALVPYCVARAQQDPNQAALAKFKGEQSSYTRSDMVTKAGWAPMDGKPSGNNALARTCEENQSGQKAS